jgi:putative addiction module component (TIGR02574 family)
LTADRVSRLASLGVFRFVSNGTGRYILIMHVSDIPNFDQLTDLQRLELAEELITSLRDREALPAPLAHQLEVERRWSDYEKDPSVAVSEEQFWKDVQARRK